MCSGRRWPIQCLEVKLTLCSEEDIHIQFNTNVFGPIRVIKGALPSLRKTGGTIVNITSVAGYDGLPSCSMYAGSKFALEGTSLSLTALHVCEDPPSPLE